MARGDSVEYDITFFAMKRSGHHAIINWMSYLFPKPIFYLNNVIPFTNPLKDQHAILTAKQSVANNHHFTHNISDPYAFMLNYEDLELNSQIKKVRPNNPFPKPKYTFNILIVRDLLNLTASRIKHYPQKEMIAKIPILWNNHILEATNVTNFLSNKIVINYNQWFISESYRRSIANSLHLPFSDEGLEKVLSFGGGSSFDGVSKNEQAQQMKVLNRYQDYLENELFRSVTNDQYLMELNEKLFQSSTISQSDLSLSNG